MQYETQSLSQATFEALRITSGHVFEEPRILMATVADLVDPDSVMVAVLYNNCNQQLLGRFADAMRSPSQETLRIAERNAARYLQDRGIDENVARDIAGEIAKGTASYLGIYYVVEAPTGMIAPPPQPRPQPQPQQRPQPQPQPRPQPQPQPRPQPSPVPPSPPSPPKTKRLLVIAVVLALLVVASVGMAFFLIGRDKSTPAHPVTISFNVNGAEEGSAETITCDSGSQTRLPSGDGLVRKGYTFAGWGTERESQQVYPANSLYPTSGDVTLYAQWKLEKSSEPTIISRDFHVAQNGANCAVVVVQNSASTTVDLTGEFSFVDSAGTVLDTKNDQAISIGPGETTMLEARSSSKGITDVNYRISSGEPQYGNGSIMSCVTMEEASCNSSGLTERITNTSDRPVVLWYTTAYGTNAAKEFALVSKPFGKDEKLQPGESRTVTFEGDQWMELDHRVYLYGYAD